MLEQCTCDCVSDCKMRILVMLTWFVPILFWYCQMRQRISEDGNTNNRVTWHFYGNDSFASTLGREITAKWKTYKVIEKTKNKNKDQCEYRWCFCMPSKCNKYTYILRLNFFYWKYENILMRIGRFFLCFELIFDIINSKQKIMPKCCTKNWLFMDCSKCTNVLTKSWIRTRLF